MADIKFTKTGYSDLEFGRSVLVPVRRPQRVIQAVDRTAGGTLQVENLGITVNERILRINNLTQAVINSLKTWHSTVAQGARNTFTYVDENGTSHTVQWLDDTLDAPEGWNNKFSVEIRLEIVSTP